MYSELKTVHGQNAEVKTPVVKNIDGQNVK
jgi:hypothetical protein